MKVFDSLKVAEVNVDNSKGQREDGKNVGRKIRKGSCFEVSQGQTSQEKVSSWRSHKVFMLVLILENSDSDENCEVNHDAEELHVAAAKRRKAENEGWVFS